MGIKIVHREARRVGLIEINARVPGGVSGEVPLTLAAGAQVRKTVTLSVE